LEMLGFPHGEYHLLLIDLFLGAVLRSFLIFLFSFYCFSLYYPPHSYPCQHFAVASELEAIPAM
jgi:hypothetical protein